MKKIALMFPGQGSQYSGMGKDLCSKSEIAKKTFREADDVLGFGISEMCFNGDEKELAMTKHAQPAILTASVAAYRTFADEWGFIPVCSAGHSLGEYSALVCSGALKFEDALKIVHKRGLFMQEAADEIGAGTMAAISGLSKTVVESECAKHSSDREPVVVSNYNSPEQTVISGTEESVKKAMKSLESMGGIVTLLKVSAPFHSPLMKTAAERLREELSKYSFAKTEFDVLSNVTALPHSSLNIPDMLVRQVVSPVFWSDSMRYFDRIGVVMALELGPQSVLKKLMKRNIPSMEAFSSDSKEDSVKLVNFMKQAKFADRIEGATVITRCMAVAVATRNRNWNEDEYKNGVIEPYRRLQQIQEELEKNSLEPTVDQMRDSLSLLAGIFDTKKTPVDERKSRFVQILEETGTVDLFPEYLE